MSRLITLAAAVCIAIATSLAIASEYEQGDLTIADPWSRPTPPGAAVGAGYMVISNSGEDDITLIGGETPKAARVSIHETVEEGGVMRMQPLREGLVVPAGGKVELKPHSYHLMLEQLTSGIEEGQQIPLTLSFEGAGDMEITLRVKSLDGDDTGGSKGHHSH